MKHKKLWTYSIPSLIQTEDTARNDPIGRNTDALAIVEEGIRQFEQTWIKELDQELDHTIVDNVLITSSSYGRKSNEDVIHVSFNEPNSHACRT